MRFHIRLHLISAIIANCCAFNLGSATSELIHLSSGQGSLIDTLCEPSDISLELISNCGWGWGNYSIHISNSAGDVNVYLNHKGRVSSFCLRADVAGAYTIRAKQMSEVEYISPEDEKEVNRPFRMSS
jgi:hypothetical protein